jgi:hypothetical protein
MGRIGLRVMNRSERDASVVTLEHHTGTLRVQPEAETVPLALAGNVAARLPRRGERGSIENQTLTQRGPKAVTSPTVV